MRKRISWGVKSKRLKKLRFLRLTGMDRLRVS
jgi:hypothetical protein